MRSLIWAFAIRIWHKGSLPRDIIDRADISCQLGVIWVSVNINVYFRFGIMWRHEPVVSVSSTFTVYRYSVYFDIPTSRHVEYHIYPKYSDTSTHHHTWSKIWTFTIYYSMLCLKIAGWVANSVDPDETPRSAASHLGLHGLLRPVCLNTYGKYGKQESEQSLSVSYLRTWPGWNVWPFSTYDYHCLLLLFSYWTDV